LLQPLLFEGNFFESGLRLGLIGPKSLGNRLLLKLLYLFDSLVEVKETPLAGLTCRPDRLLMQLQPRKPPKSHCQTL
jgi:hypothetical protein